MTSAVRGASERLPTQPAMPATARRSWWWPIGIALAVLAALWLGGFLVLRALWGGTTVTVTNGGDRPIAGIVVLAVSEGPYAEVRWEWPIGTLQPGERREIEGVFAADTNLAIRMRTADGGDAVDRLRIYLGSPLKYFVSVHLAVDGVARATSKYASGTERVYERKDIHRSLHPSTPASSPGSQPR